MLLCCWTKVTGNITSGGLQWTVGMYWYTSNSLLRPSRGAEYCDQPVCLYVCLSVCLSVHERISWTAGPSVQNFVCGCPVAMARFSSGVVALHYVLLVLWMTSTFGRNGRESQQGLVAVSAGGQLRVPPGRSLMSMNACYILNSLHWCLCCLNFHYVMLYFSLDCLVSLIQNANDVFLIDEAEYADTNQCIQRELQNIYCDYIQLRDYCQTMYPFIIT